MSNSEPSAIVFQGIPCMCGLYKVFDSNGENGSLKVRLRFAVTPIAADARQLHRGLPTSAWSVIQRTFSLSLLIVDNRGIFVDSRGIENMPKPSDLLQGTFDRPILKTIASELSSAVGLLIQNA